MGYAAAKPSSPRVWKPQKVDYAGRWHSNVKRQFESGIGAKMALFPDIPVVLTPLGLVNTFHAARPITRGRSRFPYWLPLLASRIYFGIPAPMNFSATAVFVKQPWRLSNRIGQPVHPELQLLLSSQTDFLETDARYCRRSTARRNSTVAPFSQHMSICV